MRAFINEQKGSYGMFSRSGRNTLEKFHILMKKDEIIGGYNKKQKSRRSDIDNGKVS